MALLCCATAEAKKKGYDQVLWTDAFEHKYVQEIGTMNVFFIIGNTAITPDLEQGTILDGVTRQSAITLLKEMGFTVEERPLSIDDIIDAYKAGLLIRSIWYRHSSYHFHDQRTSLQGFCNAI